MRLFIAFPVTLAPEYDSWLLELQHKTANDRIVWTQPDVRHLTLRFLGKTPNCQLPLLHRLLQLVADSTPAFHLEIGKLGVFGRTYSPQTLWLGFREQPVLTRMFHALEKKLIENGFAPAEGHFVPHISLGRIRQVDSKKKFWKTVNEMQPTYNQVIEINKVTLFCSRLEKEGPIYHSLFQCPMGNMI